MENLFVTNNYQERVPKELVDVVKAGAVLGFQNKKNLLEIAKYIAIKLDKFGGGNWLCFILPGEVEPGMSYSMNKALQISFMKETIEYIILVV